MAPHAALARGHTTGLTCHRQPPGAVRCEEQGQAEDAGAHHAHPPELQAEQGRPRPQRGHAPRAHGAGATGVGRQRPGERRPGVQGAQRWKEAAVAFARRPPSGWELAPPDHRRPEASAQTRTSTPGGRRAGRGPCRARWARVSGALTRHRMLWAVNTPPPTPQRPVLSDPQERGSVKEMKPNITLCQALG